MEQGWRGHHLGHLHLTSLEAFHQAFCIEVNLMVWARRGEVAAFVGEALIIGWSCICAPSVSLVCLIRREATSFQYIPICICAHAINTFRSRQHKTKI